MSEKGTPNAVSPPESEGHGEHTPEFAGGGPESDVNRVSWPVEYEFGGEYWGPVSSQNFYSPYGEGFIWDEEAEGFPFHHIPYYCVPEDEQDVEKFLYRMPSSARRDTVEPELAFPSSQDPRRRSLFVHSSPTHFPDVNQARKSVFGSIFLRTTGHFAEDATLLRTVADSSYSMLHSLLNSYEKIISSVSSESDRKHMALAYKQSLLKALEVHGISKSYSDGSVHWSIYPIAHDYLFSVQVGDRIHQTRLLSKIEERILTGSTQRLRMPYAWPTDSVWTGHWDSLGMAGIGTYTMQHGVSYNGKMQNGLFHDDNATLTYPNKFKALHCVFQKGKLLSCQFQFPDLLMHEKENWGYCKLPDRRFWSEVRNGLKPAKIAQKTEIDPPRKIPDGCYDTNDGFYDPKSLMLVSPSGDLLRVPVCEEDIWIKKYCRKGFLEPADFRPDLFENWFNYDQELIQNILKGQANYRAGKMTYEELQQYYADLNLLPSWSKYKRRKTPSEIALEEYINSIPEPAPLRPPRAKPKKYQGHEIPSAMRAACTATSKEELPKLEQSKAGVIRPSKSLFRFYRESRHKVTGFQGPLNAKSSKISFRFNENLTGKSSSESFRKEQQGHTKREIPEKYLEYRPILKPPFASKREGLTQTSGAELRKKKCQKRSSSSSSFSGSFSYINPEDAGESYGLLEKKELRKYIKEMIMETVTEILIKERERHRKRFYWAQKSPQTSQQKSGPRMGRNGECMKVLQELFESIPDKEEYCDSDPQKTCDLKKLAEDKYQMLKYWGKRMYLLDLKDQVP